MTLTNTLVTGNALFGGPRIAYQGRGIFSVSFPIVLTHSVVAGNSPGHCEGC